MKTPAAHELLHQSGVTREFSFQSYYYFSTYDHFCFFRTCCPLTSARPRGVKPSFLDVETLKPWLSERESESEKENFHL